MQARRDEADRVSVGRVRKLSVNVFWPSARQMRKRNTDPYIEYVQDGHTWRTHFAVMDLMSYNCRPKAAVVTLQKGHLPKIELSLKDRAFTVIVGKTQVVQPRSRTY